MRLSQISWWESCDVFVLVFSCSDQMALMFINAVNAICSMVKIEHYYWITPPSVFSWVLNTDGGQQNSYINKVQSDKQVKQLLGTQPHTCVLVGLRRRQLPFSQAVAHTTPDLVRSLAERRTERTQQSDSITKTMYQYRVEQPTYPPGLTMSHVACQPPSDTQRGCLGRMPCICSWPYSLSL